MSIESIAATGGAVAMNAYAAAPGEATASQASVYDVAQFRAQMNDPSKVENPAATESATNAMPPSSVTESAGVQNIVQALDGLNLKAQQLENTAHSFLAEGKQIAASDMLQLTVESHQFMFHCEITANVANRTADGVQQLFRQQS